MGEVMKRLLPVLLLLAIPLLAETKVTVTVIELKSGRPVKDLKAADFAVLEDKSPRQVEAAKFTNTEVDVMLLLDTSLAGGAVQPAAVDFISQLQEKEQMALVAFHSSADLIQDFTSSKDLLRRAVAGVRYGNTPKVLDALYATIDGGFEHATYRHVLVLLTTGFEGPSRTTEREVIRLARRNAVSIYPVFLTGVSKAMFENLARQTGGAVFNLRDMEKASRGGIGARVFDVLRSHYTVTLQGNSELGERVRVEVRKPEKLFASALPQE
jgi:VWFA-related protein